MTVVHRHVSVVAVAIDAVLVANVLFHAACVSVVVVRSVFVEAVVTVPQVVVVVHCYALDVVATVVVLVLDVAFPLKFLAVVPHPVFVVNVVRLQ